MSLEELEGPKQRVVQQQQLSQPENKNEVTSGPDSSVFNLFLQSMKNAGQLPDKPSPAVREKCTCNYVNLLGLYYETLLLLFVIYRLYNEINLFSNTFVLGLGTP